MGVRLLMFFNTKGSPLPQRPTPMAIFLYPFQTLRYLFVMLEELFKARRFV